MDERPMFPLGSVLLPQMVLPLQVFEPRYQALVEDCLASDREFGVTLIERGSEVGGGDIRAMAGTMAQIVQAEQMGDGRWALLAVGVRRIRVDQWLPDEPYPRARVIDWPDTPPADEVALADAYKARVRELRHVLTLAVELGMEASPTVDLSEDPVEGSFQLACLGPFGPLDRQKLLTAPGPDARLALAEDLLADQILMFEARIADS